MSKPRRLRILFSTNSPLMGYGYATQGAMIMRRLHNAGFTVGCNAFAGQVGHVGNWDGIPLYPTLNHVWGSDGLWHYQQKFKYDVVVVFADLPTQNPVDLEKVKWLIPYVPIDRQPVPPGVIQNLRFAKRIVSYSQFGYDELQKSGFISELILHGVDLENYKPLNKKESKKMWGIHPDAFVFGMVAANKENPPRKGFQEAIDAFSVFLRQHPQSLLFLHTWVDQPGGFPIKEYADYLGIKGNVVWTQHKDKSLITTESMNTIYNAFDCLLMPSYAEGFGLPVIEAAAAGVPSIVNDFSSMPEMIKPGVTGEICSLMHKRWDQQSAYIGVANPQSLYEKMEKVFACDRKKMGYDARVFMKEKYDINKIFESKWVPFFEKIEKEIYKDVPEEIPQDVKVDPMEQATEMTKQQFGIDAVKEVLAEKV